jgi:hypothetical protein
LDNKTFYFYWFNLQVGKIKFICSELSIIFLIPLFSSSKTFSESIEIVLIFGPPIVNFFLVCYFSGLADVELWCTPFFFCPLLSGFPTIETRPPLVKNIMSGHSRGGGGEACLLQRVTRFANRVHFD